MFSSYEVNSAQQQDYSPFEVDSLKNFINSKDLPDSIKVTAYLELAWLLKSSNPQEAFEYSRQAIEIAEAKNLESKTAYALRVMGVIYWQLGDFENAMNHQLEAHSLYNKLGDSAGVGRTLSNIGLIFSDQGHYERALDYYFQSLRIHEKLNNLVDMAPVLNNVGLVYQNQGEFQLAETYHLRSLNIKKELNDKKGIAFSLNNLGVISLNEGNYELALEYFKKSLDIRLEIKDQRELAATLSDIGRLYLHIDSLSLSAENIHNALEIYRVIDDQSGLAACYNYLAKVQLQKRDFAYANQLLEKSLEISQKIGLIRMVMENYKIMGDLQADRNNFRKAYEFQQQYISIRDSISSIESQRRLVEVQLVYELEKREKELELGRTKDQVSSLNFEKQILQRNFLLAGIILVLALLFLLYNRYLSITNTNKQLEQQKDEIYKNNQKLLLLNRDLMKQKQKVDELNQKLNDTNHKLLESEKHLINTNKTKDKFFSIISHDLRNPFASIVSFSRILKREIHDLNKDELQELALELDKSVLKINNLLENLLQWSRAQTGKISYKPEYIAVKDIVSENLNLFSNNAREKNIEILDEINDDLVAFADLNMANTTIRNLLSNALKYTKAGGNIKLSSEIKEGMVYISVSDTGVGISPQNIKKLFRIDTLHSTFGTGDEKGSGLGLLLCKEFVEKQGGEIKLESAEGQGTVFTFSLPLENPF